MQAKLISIEGSDGTGKSTLAADLEKRLTEKGKKVMLIHFPRYDTPLGKLILENLRGDAKMDASSFQYLYVADQMDYTRTELLHEMQKYDYIIFDRYKDSSLVYFMAKMPKNYAEKDLSFYGGTFLDMIDAGKRFRETQKYVCEPDYKIILHGEDDLLRSRLSKKNMDVHEANIDFMKKTNFIYKNLWNLIGHINPTMTMDITQRTREEVLEEALSFIESEVK